MTPDLTVARWRTSARTDGATTCVEAAVLPAQALAGAPTQSTSGGSVVAMRNSTDRDGPVLLVTDDQWDTFVIDVRAGRLDYATLASVEECGPFQIELADDGLVDVVLVNDPGGSTLRYTRQEWEAFTTGTALDGEFTLGWLQLA